MPFAIQLEAWMPPYVASAEAYRPYRTSQLRQEMLAASGQPAHIKDRADNGRLVHPCRAALTRAKLRKHLRQGK